ncbi:MAG: glycosyltransferase family 2 protein [Bacteroidetes bacterium]|nr:glycosyltransferase family 2 protein [Bacteroidota bacterium]
MAEAYPLVSIITVNYNQPEVTLAFLDSIRHITYPSYEIIVVDNASPTKKPAIIKEKHPEIILIESKENLGFAGGNNLGIRIAKGKFHLLINNDTEVDPKFLEPLVAKLQQDPKLGVVSPKIRYFYHPELIQYAGFTTINPITARNKGIGFQEVDKGQYDQDSYTEYAYGAAMMIPVEVIRKVGLMADIFFLYYEEMDWIHRIKDAGYKIGYVHNSLIFHKDSVTTGTMSPLKIYYLNRNRLLYLRRNVHGPLFLLALMYQFLIAVPKNILVFLLKGQFKLCRAYKNAIGWQVSNAFNRELHRSPNLD